MAGSKRASRSCTAGHLVGSACVPQPEAGEAQRPVGGGRARASSSSCRSGGGGSVQSGRHALPAAAAATAAAASTAHGGVLPAETGAAATRAKVDHLDGAACVSRGDGGRGDGSTPPPPAAARDAPDLRASVDHLTGTGCAVRAVNAQATREVRKPATVRGMITQHTKARSVSVAAARFEPLRAGANAFCRCFV